MVEAANGVTALQVVGQTRPDLVVTDVMMPVMNGVELIRRLRADAATRAIPILCVSGDWRVAAGADAVLSKPYKFTELISIAQDLLCEGSGGR